MRWFSTTVCLFAAYSFLGWIYESTYCTIKSHVWDNRGFLYGPICPIYGVGAILASWLFRGLAGQQGPSFAPWQVFLITAAGSAVLEYVTSWGLEKLFHAVWWDYSDMPFNLHGRISLFTTLGFGVGGLLVIYYIVPAFVGGVSRIPETVQFFLSYLVVILLTIDLTLTVSALTRFERMITQAETTFNEHMESFVENAAERVASTKELIAMPGHAATRMAVSLGNFGKSAIHRVEEFRYVKAGRDKANSLINEIRSKL